MKKSIIAIGTIVSMFLFHTGVFSRQEKYFLHKDVTVTVFWVGETGACRNSDSAWDDKWREHFGGNDRPYRRKGFYPEGFIPKENPFYCALPYRDYATKFTFKKTALERIPWAGGKKWAAGESLCKNRWLEISKGGKTVYAQWEDVGPFETDDWNYVFGRARPRNKRNRQAGLDVSPAVRDYLGLSDMDQASWRFIDMEEVPEGPWKKIVTGSPVSWN